MKKSRKEKIASEERRLKTLSGIYSLSSVIGQVKQAEGQKVKQTIGSQTMTGSEKDFSFLGKDLIKIFLFVILAIVAQLVIKLVFKI